MIRQPNIYNWLLALITSACLAACTYKAESEIITTATTASSIEIKIHVPDAEVTRGPQGGDDGDGDEAAVRHERELKNVMIFMIRHNDGINAAPETPIIYKEYIQEGSAAWNPQSYGTNIVITSSPNATGGSIPTDTYIPVIGDRIIVIANAGNRTSGISNVGQLRDFICSNSWTNGPTLKDNTHFVMTSANSDDGVIHPRGSDSSSDFVSTIHVQRLAARIDFMYAQGDNISVGVSDQLIYKVLASPSVPSSEQIATVHLTHIIPVNVMQHPSYAIKRVTSRLPIASPFTYLGSETVDAGNLPTNYVVEPHTAIKESLLSGARDVINSTLTNWYGTTCARTITDAFTDDAALPYLTLTGISAYRSTNTPQAELSYYTHYMTIAYANENTQSQAMQNPEFMTGLLLRAIYEPKVVYSDAAATVPDPSMSSYATGKTFWRWTPPGDPVQERDCKYFSNIEAANGYHSTHTGTVEKFTGGICFYTHFLRHSSSTTAPDDTYPMEYAIVRNNIYRVGIARIGRAGTPLPSIVPSDHITMEVIVRPWNKRTNSDIYL